MVISLSGLWACKPGESPQTPSITFIEPTMTFTPLIPTMTSVVKPRNTPAPRTPTKVLSSPTLTPTPIFKVCSPFAIYPLEELPQIISDPYHPPPPGREERHHGVDFSHYRRGDLLTIEGVGVQSVLAGQVASAQTDSFPYGNMVIIETPGKSIPSTLRTRLNIPEDGSLYILFAHLQEKPLVKLGDMVNACQALGKVGKTGNAVEAHLHLETRIGPLGVSFPSMRFYKTDATEEERSAYVRWRTGGEFNHFDPMKLLLPEE